MDVEKILEEVGGWGRYQKVIYFMGCLPCVMSAMITVGYSWTAFTMDHRCLVQGCESANNATYAADFLNKSTPPDPDYTWSRCSVYRRLDKASHSSGACDVQFLHNETEQCTQWVYDTSVMESSLVSEFDLVCDDETLQPLGDSIFFVGVAVGSILSGIAADRKLRAPYLPGKKLFFIAPLGIPPNNHAPNYLKTLTKMVMHVVQWAQLGRMVALMGELVLTVVFSTAAAFANSYALFTALRALSAVASFGFFCIPFVLSMELTSVEVRAFCGIVINIFFAIGEALSGVFPIFVKDWKNLQLIYSLPTILFLSYWFFLPESPRWLVSVGKHEKAEKVLRNVAKWNGKDFPEDLVKQEQKAEKVEGQEAPSESVLTMLKSYVLLKRTVILCIQWIVTSMVYYGIGLVSTNLAGDIYLNYILTMFIEIPSYVFATFTVNPLGRKLLVGGAFLLCGLGTILAGALNSQNITWLTTTLALVGKFGAAAVFSLMYLYTAELYPTSLRGQGVGIASCCGRIGTIAAPFISDLGNGSPTLPLCVFGVCGLVAAAVTAFLPETSGQDLPTTIEEAINFGKDQSLLPIPWLERRRKRRGNLHGENGPAAE